MVGAAPAPLTDALFVLVRRMQAGDRVAFTELFDRTNAQIHARARSITRHHFDAEDAVSEVFEQAWTRAAAYDPSRGSVLGWLLMMCRSRSIDLIRERKSREGDNSFVFVGCAAESLTTEGIVSDLQQDGNLRRALTFLSPTRRRLLVLAYFFDLTHAEIATVLQVPLGTVKSHLRRALASMRRSLGTGDGTNADLFQPLSECRAVNTIAAQRAGKKPAMPLRARAARGRCLAAAG